MIRLPQQTLAAFVAIVLLVGCRAEQTPTEAEEPEAKHIVWREHRIDDEGLSRVPLRGGDGLEMADLDLDGIDDIVSVHESDVRYGVADGHVRIAFGSEDPNRWLNVSLASGEEVGAAEDVAIGDINGDGFPDIVVACELAHVIYFENPGARARTAEWKRHIPTATLERGSFIRVFLADLSGDGRLELIAVNKGAQTPREARSEIRSISLFQLQGEPLSDASWVERTLARLPWPINARPVDLDGDGDMDIVAGSVAQARIFWLENLSTQSVFEFEEREISLGSGSSSTVQAVNGFNMDFADLNRDGRTDIVTFDVDRMLGLGAVWLQQPESPTDEWRVRRIGDYRPDLLVGIKVADIDGDGDDDVMTGGYSLGSRTEDNQASADDALGRLAWFENLGMNGTDWRRHDISRRERGMFDMFVARDMDADGDIDFVGTRGNSGPYDGVFWLEQLQSSAAAPAFAQARKIDSPEIPIPESAQ